MKIAKVGNVIEFKNGLTGIVEKVNENSVIVDVTIMENYRDLELDSLTVVNHKTIKLLKTPCINQPPFTAKIHDFHEALFPQVFLQKENRLPPWSGGFSSVPCIIPKKFDMFRMSFEASHSALIDF